MPKAAAPLLLTGSTLFGSCGGILTRAKGADCTQRPNFCRFWLVFTSLGLIGSQLHEEVCIFPFVTAKLAKGLQNFRTIKPAARLSVSPVFGKKRAFSRFAESVKSSRGGKC